MFPLTKELSYILGVFLGDGHTQIYPNPNGGNNYTFRLNVIDIDFIKEAERCIKVIIPDKKTRIYKLKIPQNSKYNLQQQYLLQVSSKPLVLYLRTITGNKQFIPDSILKSTPEIQKEFLAGFLDSDGWVQIYGGKNKNQIQVGMSSSSLWIDELAKMVQKLGVTIGKRQFLLSNKPNRLPMVRYILKTDSFIKSGCYFKIKRKQDRLNEYKAVTNRMVEREKIFNRFREFLVNNSEISYKRMQKLTGINYETARLWKWKIENNEPLFTKFSS